MVALRKTIWTPESYLAFEEKSEVRHEYLNGEVLAMAGASRKHNLIAASILTLLTVQVRKRPCEVYMADMRVKISRLKEYTYPDVVVVCGTPQIEQEHGDNLVNPTVIIEVASPSTENYDRGAKFKHYRTIESLQEYLVVSQDEIQIDHHRREGDMWILTDITSLEAVIHLPSIDCQLEVGEVYAKVSFEPEQPSQTVVTNLTSTQEIRLKEQVLRILKTHPNGRTAREIYRPTGNNAKIIDQILQSLLSEGRIYSKFDLRSGNHVVLYFPSDEA